METKRLSKSEHQGAVGEQDRKGLTPIMTRKQKQNKTQRTRNREGKLTCVSETKLKICN